MISSSIGDREQLVTCLGQARNQLREETAGRDRNLSWQISLSEGSRGR